MPTYTALSIVAPHGEGIASGRKVLEVRSWCPPCLPLVDLLIVENTRLLLQDGDSDDAGRAVALVDVHAVAPWLPSEVDAACSSGWVPGYWAWRLENVRPIAGRPAVVAKRKLYEVHVHDVLRAEPDVSLAHRARHP